MKKHQAQCTCGQLTATVQGDSFRISICHCLACQRRTGSAFGYQARFYQDKVCIQGSYQQYTRVADSGNKVDSFFCPICGSTLFYQIDQEPDVVAIPAGAFADPQFPAPKVSVHEGRRHGWFQITTDVEHFD